MKGRVLYVDSYHYIFLLIIISRLTEALKNGGLKRTLKNLGLDEGIGANGELTDDQLNTPIENEDCRRVFENVRATYQSLDAAVPGNFGHFPLNL